MSFTVIVAIRNGLSNSFPTLGNKPRESGSPYLSRVIFRLIRAKRPEFSHPASDLLRKVHEVGELASRPPSFARIRSTNMGGHMTSMSIPTHSSQPPFSTFSLLNRTLSGSHRRVRPGGTIGFGSVYLTPGLDNERLSGQTSQSQFCHPQTITPNIGPVSTIGALITL